jgi:acetylornithine deacetylase/succinyl-diaminopimelate desuccinylase-like protein
VNLVEHKTAASTLLLGALAAFFSVTVACASACNTVPRVVDDKSAPAPAQESVLQNVDWKGAGDEAFADLRTYLMADTTNPPREDGTGGEKPGADVLAALLAKDGIESTTWQVDEKDPRRVTLVARLKAEHATQGPLCLVSHIDVVTAEPSRWKEPPFGGVVDGQGFLWGRGALDMKGMGLLEAEVMRQLKRLNAKLDRDVIMLAVADEEVGSGGMRDAVEHHWQELGCTESVNEGGMGLRDAVVDGQTVFPISVGEKGVLWLKMIAEGAPGHGSTPVDGRAPGQLLKAMDRIRARQEKPRVDPELYELLYDVGSEAGGVTGFVMTKPFLVDSIVVGRFMEKPITHAVIVDTVNLTGFAGAHEPNVVPSQVWAQYDVRLLPGTRPDDVIAEFKALTADITGIRFEVLDRPMLAAVSEWDDPFYRALAHHAVAVSVAHGEKRVVAGPILSPGFTDSIFLRGKGVRAYGFVPFIVTSDDMGTMHGDGERVSKQNVQNGLETLLRAVVDVSVAN